MWYDSPADLDHGYRIAAIEGDGRQWILWKNNSGYTAPQNGVLAETGLVRDDGPSDRTNRRNVITCGFPGVTFQRNYYINGYAEVPNDSIGVCCSFEAPCEAAYEGGTPAEGQTWGPKPGSWNLNQGFPGFSVVGVNGDNALAVVRGEPIVQLLCKATSDLANNAATSTSSASGYKIYTGAQGAEVDGGWTTVPAAYNRTGATITSGSWFLIEWINSEWEICGSAPRSACCCSKPPVQPISWEASTPRWRSPADSRRSRRRAAPTGVTSAANFHHLSGQVGDTLTIVQDTSTGTPAYYLLQVTPHATSGGGSIIFAGQLNGMLSGGAATASVDSLSSNIAGVSAPGGSVTANNPLGLAGQDNDACYVLQNNHSSTSYELLAVAFTRSTWSRRCR